jgi:hypothetical protein
MRTGQIVLSKKGHVSGEKKQEMQKDVIRLCKKRAFRVAGSLALF